MKKARVLSFLGVWIAVLPFLGFPSSWKNILFTLSGIILVYLSYIFYRTGYKTKESQKKMSDNFRENHDFHENRFETIENESEKI